MASKRKLKNKIRKLRTENMLLRSDKLIEMEDLLYRAMQAEAKADRLADENRILQGYKIGLQSLRKTAEKLTKQQYKWGIWCHTLQGWLGALGEDFGWRTKEEAEKELANLYPTTRQYEVLPYDPDYKGSTTPTLLVIKPNEHQ
jgi:hypothetical protein